MKRPLPITTYFLLLIFLLTACAQKPTGPQPPDIAYGQTVCDACGMIIDDAHFAGATITVEGKTHQFDDIGEMLVYHMEHLEEQAEVWFVHDYATETWIRGETAFYVMSEKIASPMAGGVVAFADQAAAATYAAEHQATVMSFDDVRVAVHLKVHG